MNLISYIQKQVEISTKSIENTLQLLQEDCTIPFIARYRKDRTGNLDEVQIGDIAKWRNFFEELTKRKDSILKSIEEQNALTPELKDKIEACFDLSILEDLYLPYKKKRKTKADIAREAGLEPLAKILMAQNATDIEKSAQKFIQEKTPTIEDALQGARDIIAEWISENSFYRQALRRKFQKESLFSTKVVKSKKEEEAAQKFAQYFEWEESLTRMPAHRLLACLRGENEGFLKVQVSIDKQQALDYLEQKIIKDSNMPIAKHLQKAIADSYKRLLEPALSNEILQLAKQKADEQSISVFADNLSQLLLGAPLGQKRILAIDPGFKSGCKIVCIDQQGNLLTNETIFPHAPQNQSAMAMKKIRSLVNAYKIEAIAIGNGTASRETEFFIKKTAFDKPIQVFIVNEAGASIYSASKIAREEFPNYDVTVRGAVSIGRRLQDPLAELVKIDPKSIGVGQYQHDVDQTLLKNALDQTVVHAVNNIGINLNTASKSLLSYVSGIGEKLAENIVLYRKDFGAFEKRSDLKKVPRLGDKAYQQAAAFLRIQNPKHPLDNSSVHPEAYAIVEKMAKEQNITLEELIGNKAHIENISVEEYVSNDIGEFYLKDLLKELEKPGLDPRKTAKIFEFDTSLRTINDIEVGKVVPGIVNNITNFGCFVDIGIKESGLVHISQLKEGFVSDVNEIVKLHQHVIVKIIEVDIQKKRIQLSMIV